MAGTEKPLIAQTPAERSEFLKDVFGEQKKPKGAMVMETVEIQADKPKEAPKTTDEARTDAVKNAMDK